MALTKITPQMFDTSATAHDLNVDNGTFVVDGSASRVGIGTATPSTLLHVDGTATATTFVGALTGNVTGTILTAAQTNITSLGTLSALTVSGTLTGSDILLNDSGNNERSLRVQNSTVSSYLGVEGSSANRFVGSAANNMFLGTTTADGIEFATNNNVRAVIDSSGNVGIGTTSPNTNLQLYHATDDISINVNHGTGGSYPKKSGISFGATSTSLGGDATFTGGAGIQVTNTAATNNPTEMAFFTTANGAPTTRMFIDSDGNVGIGSDSPDGLLTIKGNSDAVSTPSIRLLDGTDTREVSISNTSGDFVVSTHGTDNAAHGQIKIFEAGLITIANGGASGSLTERLRIDTSGDVQARRARSNTAGQVTLSVQPSDSTIHYGFRIDSSTNSLNLDRADSGNEAQLLTVNASGDIGIGVTVPTQKLDVRGGAGAGTLTHAIFTGTAGRGLQIRTRSDTSGGQNSGTAEINSADSEGTGGDLAFSSNGNVRMFIDGGGNVGIGTTSPGVALHIANTSQARLALDTTAGNTRRFDLIGDSNGFTIRDQSAAANRMTISTAGNTSLYGGLGINNDVISGTQVYVKKLDNSTNLMRWGEGTSSATTYRFRIDQNFDFIANSGSGDTFAVDSATGNVAVGHGSPTARMDIISTGSATYSGSSAGSNIALKLRNLESGAVNRTVGIAMSSESNAEVYLNCVTNSINNGGDFVIANRHAGGRSERHRFTSDGRQIRSNASIVSNHPGHQMNLGYVPHSAAYGSGTTSGVYLHMKMAQRAGGNSSITGINVMSRYEYKGYGYGGGFLHSGMSFYTYVGTSSPYGVYTMNNGNGNGMSAYYSTDSYVVIVVHIVANNYTGGVLYFQSGITHRIEDNQITSINYSNSTTGVF